MKNQKLHKFLLLFVFGFMTMAWAVNPYFLNRAWAGKFLADRHQDRGMNCASCHKESAPKSAMPSAFCLQCHGGKQKLADKTKDVMPNPHDSHQELACEKCHHGHKASENGCAQCHEFELKVP